MPMNENYSIETIEESKSTESLFQFEHLNGTENHPNNEDSDEYYDCDDNDDLYNCATC